MYRLFVSRRIILWEEALIVSIWIHTKPERDFVEHYITCLMCRRGVSPSFRGSESDANNLLCQLTLSTTSCADKISYYDIDWSSGSRH